ncbi:hypothetical protein D3C76_792840 [compost metagenome]
MVQYPAVRAGQENCPGTRGNRLGQQRCINGRHPHQRGAAGLERRVAGRVHRIDDNHLVPGGEQAFRRDEQGVLRPCQRDHVCGVEFTPKQLAVVPGERFT